MNNRRLFDPHAALGTLDVSICVRFQLKQWIFLTSKIYCMFIYSYYKFSENYKKSFYFLYILPNCQKRN